MSELNQEQIDEEVARIGLKQISHMVNGFLRTNSPSPQDRENMKMICSSFPQFKIKSKIYRATRTKKKFSAQIRNNIVSGCITLEDVYKFVNKRYDKGYNYILKSIEDIECFNLHAFIEYINEKHGKVINSFYQDEKEVLFLFKAPYNWYEVESIQYKKSV